MNTSNLQKRPIEDIEIPPTKRTQQLDPLGKPLKILKKVDGTYNLYTFGLGRGSFGTTVLVSHKDSTEFMACKMIDKAVILKKKINLVDMLQERLQAEIDTWRKMNHPNIVQFRDFRESSNYIYMFMEYCVCTLEKYLRPPLMKISEDKAMNYFKQIASGCHYLYIQNVVHRDLKPSNILIHKDGTIKIADFGFAKYMDESNKDTQLDQTGQIGTVVYMSPQVYERKPYSIKTDIWSLGIIFYEVLIGRTPDSFLCSFQGQVDSTTVLFPPTVKITNEMKNLIKSMLVKDEAGRISISELVEKLEQMPVITQENDDFQIID